MNSPLKLPDDVFGERPPREVTVRTVMLYVTMASVTFGLFAAADAPILGGFFAGLGLLVALAQRWMFGGRRPILASLIAGGLFCSVTTYSGLTPHGFALHVLLTGPILGLVVGLSLRGLYYVFFTSVETPWKMPLDANENEPNS